MSATKSKGFSQLPHGFHKRLIELKGARLSIWLAHRCMEGQAGESYPSLDRLVEYTGLNLHTVTDARKWLRANGWLTSSGQKHTSQGKFSIPIEHTTIPEPAGGKIATSRTKTVSGKSTNGGAATAGGKTTNGASGKSSNGAGGKTAGGFTACGKPTTEVDPKDFEVDPALEVDPNELHPTTQPIALGLDDGLIGGEKNLETKSKAAGIDKSILTETAMLEHLQRTHVRVFHVVDGQKGHEGHYEYLKVPPTPNITGSKELFEDLRRRGITHIEQMNLVCVAYESWFQCKYLASFEEKSDAEDRRDQQQYESEQSGRISAPVYIPEPIRCPLVMFRKELAVFLDEAREQLDEVVTEQTTGVKS
jgi:hypothetical protein